MKKSGWNLGLCMVLAVTLAAACGAAAWRHVELSVTETANMNSGASEDAVLVQERKKVALTFDDVPNEEYTAMLLDGLKERGVKATFFVLGQEAENHPELMERMVEEGHLIGNHTYSHVNLSQLTDSAAREEIEKANQTIERYTGQPVCFLRPPFGAGKKELEQELEMIQVLWTVDTMDWACQDEGKICETVFSQVKDGSIILMHDEYLPTVRAALSVIDCMQEQGYEFVTVDEILMD